MTVTADMSCRSVARRGLNGGELNLRGISARLGRLLRRMRAFASGLGAISDPAPVRLLRLPRRAVQLLEAYRQDPAWSDEALASVSAGAKTAMAFVGWTRELGRVYEEQPHVQDFLRQDGMQ